MTPEQNKLIDKTIGLFGYLSLAGAAGLTAYGAVWTFTNDKDLEYFIKGLLDIDGAGYIFYPLIGTGVICLWIRAFLRAGQKQN